MRPAYADGEKVYVTDCDFRRVKVGDVVLAWWIGRELLVPHRVISISEVDGRQADSCQKA